MTLSETREQLCEGKERAKDAIKEGGLGQASDQILGNNNIGDGPFDRLFHARPAAVKQEHSNRTDRK